MRKKLHLSLPIGASLIVVVLIAFFLPAAMELVKDTHTALDGGGLARLVESEDVDVFLSTSSPALMNPTLQFLGSERELPILPDGGVYELAISRTASGAVWVVAATDARGHVQSFLTPLGATLSLPEPAKPFASDTLFRQSRKERESEFLWMKPDALRGSTLITSLLSPSEWVLLTWNETGSSGVLTLFGSEELIQPLQELGPIPRDQGSLLSTSVHASRWMQTAWASLRTLDPNLSVGIEGIALSLLQNATGSTDTTELLESLTEPIYIGLTRRNGKLIPYIAGTAEEEVINAWLRRIRSEHAAGEIRRIDLGEYVYTDVALVEDNPIEDSTSWQVTSISTDGSLVIATLGTSFLLGSAEDIENALSTGITHPSTDGRASISWVSETLDLPSSLLEDILGETNTHIQWSLKASALRRSFEWRFTEQ